MSFDGRKYQARFDELAASGMDMHGEARFVLSFGPGSVLDAGCGTGRVAIELARRGLTVTGVDVSESMITEARRLAPDLDWQVADLARLDLDRKFDVVVLAGNVPLFCPVDDRSDLVRACGRHVAPGGHLISGFSLDRDYALDDYDAAVLESGLGLVERWATWDGAPFTDAADYAVSVHLQP